MKKGITIALILFSMIAGTIVGTMATLAAISNHLDSHSVSVAFSNNKLNAIWDLIENNYVDPIKGDTITDRLYASMLNTLDPHSNYLTKDEMLKETEALRGNFEGVGIVLQVRNDTVCASRIIEDGPADHAGLIAGDRILTVDGRKVSGVKMASDSVVNLLRGRRRSIADVEILRLSEGHPRKVKITRDVITTPTVSYSGMTDKTTGYIRLTRFGDSTYEEFCEALKGLKQKGMKRLVLDLRDNGGGVLSSAIGICDELLPGKEMIVYTEGAHQRRDESHSKPGGLFCEGDLIVMIDEYSASASEIVSGAIQDNDRGIIVGRRSFGKGLVQQQFMLPDNSAVLLTIARYYTPSGRCIQRPYSNGAGEYYADFARQLMDEYDSNYSETPIVDSTPYYTTNGRTVYGGGGITPDHIIHIKTDNDVAYYNMLVNKGIMNDFTFDIVSRQGSSIKQRFKSETDFIANYNVSNQMMQELFAMGEKRGLKKEPASIRKYENEIRSRIKAEIGEMLYSPATFYRIILKYDPEIEEAMKLWGKELKSEK